MATFTHAPRSITGRIPQTPRNVAAVVVGIFLAMHGVAHSLAFFTQWQISPLKGINYATTLFYGKIDVGDVGIRIDGLLWLVTTAAFVVIGLRLAWLRRVELRPFLAVTLFSLALCVLGLSQAIVGAWIDRSPGRACPARDPQAAPGRLTERSLRWQSSIHLLAHR